jgi:predicted ester cyclase
MLGVLSGVRWEEVLNHHHLDRLAAYLSPDVIVHPPSVPPGLAGARQVLASYFTAFPDFHLVIEAVLALDGELLARLWATGTHPGEFLGVAPTGLRVSVCALERGGCKPGGAPSTGCSWTCSASCTSSGPSHRPAPPPCLPSRGDVHAGSRRQDARGSRASRPGIA